MNTQNIEEEFRCNNLEVIIPSDPKFKNFRNEFESLYMKNQKAIADPNPFVFILYKTFFYGFIDNGAVLGAIYFFMENGKLFLNAFSVRKKHSQNLLSLNLAKTWFIPPIYAEAQNRASAFCLLKCGFERVEDNLFVYKG